MKRLLIFLTLIAIAICSISNRAEAVTITHDINFDIGTLMDEWDSGGKYWMGYNSPVSVGPFFVQADDILETRVNFLPGQSIRLNNGSTLWGYGVESLIIGWDTDGGPYSDAFSSTSNVTFFTPDGNIVLNGSDGQGLLSQNIFGNITNGSVEFTGFSMTTRVVSAPDVSYDRFMFHTVVSGRTELITTTPVPEPSTWLLMGAGLVGLMAMRMRNIHLRQ